MGHSGKDVLHKREALEVVGLWVQSQHWGKEWGGEKETKLKSIQATFYK